MNRKLHKIINICLIFFVVAAISVPAFFAAVRQGVRPNNPLAEERTTTQREREREETGGGSGTNGEGNFTSPENMESITKQKEENPVENNNQHVENTNSNNSFHKIANAVNTKLTNGDKKSGVNRTGTESGGKHSTDEGNGTDTDTIYFTTSIIDGETVSQYEYSFTITHKIAEIHVEQLSVYVNDSLVANFSGNVLLAEGANQIQIVVIYRDSDGQEIIARKSYTVSVDTKDLWITTDLKEQTTENPFLQFLAYAQMGEKQAKMTVTVNDEKIVGESNQYAVILIAGNNVITLRAECDGCIVIKKYVVIFQPKQEYSIYTNLKNQTVNTQTITFQAFICNGTPKAKLSVVVNGTMITGEKETYQAVLKNGNNTIRLKATDSNAAAINQTYTIKYVPVATPETEPKMTFINISDGMNISGENFTLKIGAKDYEGNRIYYDGICVVLNGKKIQYRWSNTYTSYYLDLKNGKNQLEIRLTDNDGRYKDFSYCVYCTYIEEGTPIGTVTLSIDAKVLNIGLLMKPKKVDIYYGDTGADVFQRAMENSGYTYEYIGTVRQGFYLEALCRPGMLRGWRIDETLKNEILEDGLQFNVNPETGEYIYDMDSLGTLDFCQGSGWTYSVNGEYKECGMSEYIPADEDEISVRYTLAYGKDIGAYSSSGGVYGIKEQYRITY